MTTFSIALFVHILGAMIYFVAFGLEQASLASLRRATLVGQAREWLNVFSWLRWLGPISLILILLSGFYMMAIAVGWTAWIVVTLISMVLIAVIGGAVAGTRMGAIEQMIAKENGQMSSALRQRLSDPLLSISMQVRTAIALGIVFLMTIKPNLAGSIITLIVAIIVGFAAAYPALRVAPLGRSQ
ncbi:MAG: hypothetical protein M1282_19075 [Chloroflexi bacterium]|nr:hypothetical protein [Chloroflexota bacterium]